MQCYDSPAQTPSLAASVVTTVTTWDTWTTHVSTWGTWWSTAAAGDTWIMNGFIWCCDQSQLIAASWEVRMLSRNEAMTPILPLMQHRDAASARNKPSVNISQSQRRLLLGPYFRAFSWFRGLRIYNKASIFKYIKAICCDFLCQCPIFMSTV